ncbi:MAG TPA: hypothetical protein VMP01_13615 [Pirellulaceae bacterium]|nr:hypothetical protein [Pirellulaceae bacterium]
MSTTERDLITVATYWDPMQAQIARLRLAHEGIPAFLEKEFTVLTAWHFTNAIGGIRLNVPVPRHEEARSVLAAKVSFDEWRDTGCWELSLAGQAVLPPEEPNAAARQRRYDLPLSEREELAQRAFRAAVLGVAWLTPLPFACAHLVRFHTARGRCRIAYRRRARIAAWLVAAVLSLLIVAIAWIVWEPHYFRQTVERRERIYQARFSP